MDYWVVGFLVLTAGIILRSRLWIRLTKWKTRDEDEEKEKGTKKGMIPKGSLGWPVIGETLAFIACGYSSRPVTFMDKRKSLYGKAFKTNIIGTPIIISTDAEVNKVVLQNHGNTFVPAYPKSITELLGENSILSINGPHQKRLHTIIGAFFRSPHLKERITRDIEASVGLTLDSWAQLPVVHVQDEIKRMTFEVLVKLLMSISRGEDLDILKLEFEEFIKGLICIPINFPGTRLYKSLKAKERLIKIVKKVVKERQVATTERKNSPANDAVDVLLRDVSDGASSDKQSQRKGYVDGDYTGIETFIVQQTKDLSFPVFPSYPEYLAQQIRIASLLGLLSGPSVAVQHKPPGSSPDNGRRDRRLRLVSAPVRSPTAVPFISVV
ncbi:hypothetical protein Bca101_079997 [Brassica carinata]